MLTEGQKQTIRERISIVFRAIEEKQNELNNTPQTTNRLLVLMAVSSRVNKYSGRIEQELINPAAVYDELITEVQNACLDYEAQTMGV